MIARTGLSLLLWLIAAALLALTVVGVFSLPENYSTVAWIALAQAPLYALALWLVLRRPGTMLGDPRRALVSILIIGGLLRLVLVPAPPSSTDIHRYVWDGRVQAAGINPYRYVPADPALQNLRDERIYGWINRADYAPTIYPPVAQMIFFAATRISESVTMMKVTLVAFEGLAVWALLQLLQARGMPSSRILAYLWHPLPLWSFASDGHVDIIATAFLLLAFVAADRRSPFWAGIALAAGVLTKYFPIVTAPALYRRWDWRLPLAFVVSVALLYLPYLGVGSKVFGFLGGYVAEEGVAGGSGIYLWSLLRHVIPLPDGAVIVYFAFAAIAMAAVAIARMWRVTDPRADIATALILAVMFLLFFSPHYPWYFAWAAPFLCFYPVVGVIYLTCAASLINVADWPPSLAVNSIIYGIMGALLVGELFLRRNLAKEAPRERALVA